MGKAQILVLVRSLFIAMLGVFPLLNVLSNPRLASLRGVEIVQIIAVGFCFGVAFGTAIVGFSSAGRSSGKQL